MVDTINVNKNWITKPIANLTALKAYSVTATADGVLAIVIAIGTSPGGIFEWNAASTETADDLNIILPTGWIGPGRWERTTADNHKILSTGLIDSSILEVASATRAGVVTTGTQSIAGLKTFVNDLTVDHAGATQISAISTDGQVGMSLKNATGWYSTYIPQGSSDFRIWCQNTLKDVFTLTSAGALQIGNIKLDTNTISSTNTGGDIILSPNGTGTVRLDRTDWGALYIKYDSYNWTGLAIYPAINVYNAGGTTEWLMTASNIAIGNAKMLRFMKTVSTPDDSSCDLYAGSTNNLISTGIISYSAAPTFTSGSNQLATIKYVDDAINADANTVWDGAVAFSVFYAANNIGTLTNGLIIELKGTGHTIDNKGSVYLNMEYLIFQSIGYEKTINISNGATFAQLPSLSDNVTLQSQSTSFVVVNPTIPIFATRNSYYACDIGVVGSKFISKNTSTLFYMYFTDRSGIDGTDREVITLSGDPTYCIVLMHIYSATYIDPTALYSSAGGKFNIAQDSSCDNYDISDFTHCTSGVVSINYIDYLAVHKDSAETITGVKTFNATTAIPLYSSAPTFTPGSNQLCTVKYAEDLVSGENFWDRASTTLSPHTAGDSVNIGAGSYTGSTMALTNAATGSQSFLTMFAPSATTATLSSRIGISDTYCLSVKYDAIASNQPFGSILLLDNGVSGQIKFIGTYGATLGGDIQVHTINTKPFEVITDQTSADGYGIKVTSSLGLSNGVTQSNIFGYGLSNNIALTYTQNSTAATKVGKLLMTEGGANVALYADGDIDLNVTGTELTVTSPTFNLHRNEAGANTAVLNIYNNYAGQAGADTDIAKLTLGNTAGAYYSSIVAVIPTLAFGDCVNLEFRTPLATNDNTQVTRFKIPAFNGNKITSYLTMQYSAHPTFTVDTDIVDKKYVDDAIGGENLWDRVDGILSPHTITDSLQLLYGVNLYNPGVVCYATYSDSINLDYGDGTLTGTSHGGAAVAGGWLDLAYGYTVMYVDYNGTDNISNLVQTGTVRWLCKPHYDYPTDTQVLFSSAATSGSALNLIKLRHQQLTGDVLLTINDSAGSTIINGTIVSTLGFTADAVYEMVLTFDVTTGYAKFYCGLQGGTISLLGTLSGTGTRSTNIGNLCVGSDYTDNTPNFKIKRLQFFDTVAVTAAYTSIANDYGLFTTIRQNLSGMELPGNNLLISPNAISATNTNGNINLNPNGTGKVVSSALKLASGYVATDANGNLTATSFPSIPTQYLQRASTTLSPANLNDIWVGYNYKIVNHTNTSTPYSITASESGTVFQNFGASDDVTFNLPAAAAGLRYEFISLIDGKSLIVKTTSGTYIWDASDISTDGGTIHSNLIQGASLILVAFSTTGWQVMSSRPGTGWTLT